jgi:hypothetical protein
MTWFNFILGLGVGCILFRLCLPVPRMIYNLVTRRWPLWWLVWVDLLFGPALAIAPRCELCNRVTANLEQCRLKHKDPRDNGGGCGMMLCHKCNQEKPK